MRTVLLFVTVFVFLYNPQLINAESSSFDQGSIPDLLADEFEEEGFDEEFGEEFTELEISDPLEPMNRVFFEFNDTVYEWVIKPVTNGYIWVVPRELREGFGNFFFNLAMPVRLLNTLLQGNLEQSGTVLSRFFINSTLGVYGLVDIASIEFDKKPTEADFGQTLGKWGLGDGIYICWPFFGPSSIRDTVGLVVDAYSHPIPYFHDSRTLDFAYYTSNRINTLSLNPDIYDELKRYSLDPYVASRQAYFEYRRSLVEKR